MPLGQISTSFRWGPGLPGPPLAAPLTWEHNAAIESYRSGNTSELAKIHMKYSQNYLHNSESHLTMHRANGLTVTVYGSIGQSEWTIKLRDYNWTNGLWNCWTIWMGCQARGL